MNPTIFLTGFSIYILFFIWLGWKVSRNQKTSDDFLFGGRSVPMLLTLGTTAATMVGTGTSMGAVGFAYKNGWGGFLYGLGGGIGILALAWFFGFLRDLKFDTMSDEISHYVGDKKLVKNIVGILIFVASIGWLGAHILGGSLYLSWATNIDLETAKILIALGFVVYIIIGGYTAVVWADTIQAIILFAGFILLAIGSVKFIGGLDNLYNNMEPAATTPFGIAKIGVIPAISLAFVVCVGVMAAPSFRQRIYSAKSVNTLKVSFTITGIVYLFFAALPAIIGMSARIVDPNLENVNFAFPHMTVAVFGPFLALIVLLAGLSATISSASSDAIAGVSILLSDIYTMILGKKPPKDKEIFYSRVATFIVIFVAFMLAYTSNDIISYITKMVSTVMSGLFVCTILGRFWKKYNWAGAFASLVSASITSLIVINSESLTTFWGNPVIPSVVVSMVFGIIATKLLESKQLASEA